MDLTKLLYINRVVFVSNPHNTLFKNVKILTALFTLLYLFYLFIKFELITELNTQNKNLVQQNIQCIKKIKGQQIFFAQLCRHENRYIRESVEYVYGCRRVPIGYHVLLECISLPRSNIFPTRWLARSLREEKSIPCIPP